MFYISVIFKITKKGRLHFGKLIRLKSFIDALNVIYQLSEIKDDIDVVSQFPCLLRHPVLYYAPCFDVCRLELLFIFPDVIICIINYPSSCLIYTSHDTFA